MKIADAMKIINDDDVNRGFMVGFEKHEDGCFSSDNFPDKNGGEKLIDTEEKAWELARQFADSTGDDIVNIYVKDHNFSPVHNYQEKMIRKFRRLT